ncbi:MAG: purine-nucleoside phosphorylase [Acidobacteria bacterium]|nr:purine-nucleoside phosphorylase [Acidobacteriota bacterium]
MSVSIFERAQTSARYLREQIKREIDVAVVLGSGLGAFAEKLEEKLIIPYEQIPDFARSTVEGHSGRLVVGTLPGTALTIAVMQGRFHYYEGYSLEEVTLPLRTFGALNVKRLVLTNAAGGVNTAYRAGDLMLITDHINLMMISPLRGQHDDRLGARFPDMTEVYSRAYRQFALESAAELGIKLHEGVYMSLQGPNYETPAEVRMLRLLGADAVGMSTVPEAIVARQMGMQTLGISLITNAAAGVEEGEINHAEVMEMGQRVSGQFGQLLSKIIARM